MPRISDVHVINLRFDYEFGKGYRAQRGRTTGGFASLIEVTLDNGLKGLGPVYTHPNLLEVIVEHQFKPFLLGQDAGEIDAIWQNLYGVTKWYGRKGLAMSALGGVDTALWDLRGKLEDKPVYELLGGTECRVPAYGSGLLWNEDLAALARQASEDAAEGFKFLKMRIGVNPDHDRRSVETVLAAVPDDVRILVDGGQRLDLEHAIELGRFLQERGAYFFEEPFPPEMVEEYAALNAELAIPVAAGENEFGVQGFAELFRMKAIDIAQPDVSRAGGISEVHRIAQLAEQHGVRIITHTWSDAVTIVANAHVVTAAPNGVMVEMNRFQNPLVDDLLVSPSLELDDDGQITLSDAPGLGIELNPEALAAYTVPPGEPAMAGYYSDMIFGSAHLEKWPPYPMDSIPDGPPPHTEGKRFRTTAPTWTSRS